MINQSRHWGRLGLIAIGFWLVTVTISADPTGVAAGLSIETPNYDRVYWTPALELQFPAGKGIEFETGLGYGINVDANNNPRFVLPIWGGMNVLFGESRNFQFLVGIGLKPQFMFGTDAWQTLIGPYLKAGIRVAVHPSAQWFLEVEQTLLIGPPKWLYTETKVFSGINFNIGTAR
jgi:hypothetical protein